MWIHDSQNKIKLGPLHKVDSTHRIFDLLAPSPASLEIAVVDISAVDITVVADDGVKFNDWSQRIVRDLTTGYRGDG